MFRPLKSGDKIAITAPASPYNRDEFELGIKILKKQQLNPIFDPQLLTPPHNNYLFLSDQYRANQFNHYLKDPEIKLIMMARGGYGSVRTLSHMDHDLILKHQKPIIGFSDITTFHLFLNQYDIPTIHGPMVTALGRNSHSTQKLFSLLKGEQDQLIFPLISIQNRVDDLSGKITGGNLTVLASLIGTPLMPDLSESFLFLEDLNEPLYKIDRMLMQLKLSENTPKLFLLGQFQNCGSFDKISAILSEIFPETAIFSGIDVGHEQKTETLLLGVKAFIKQNQLHIPITL